MRDNSLGLTKLVIVRYLDSEIGGGALISFIIFIISKTKSLTKYLMEDSSFKFCLNSFFVVLDWNATNYSRTRLVRTPSGKKN